MIWPLLQLDPVAQGLYPVDQPSGSSADPLDQRHLSQRVEGRWLILQQSLNNVWDSNDCEDLNWQNILEPWISSYECTTCPDCPVFLALAMTKVVPRSRR